MGSGAFPAVGLAVAVSLIQLALSIPVIRGMREKWEGKPFSFAVTSTQVN
jgi:hypothetical protein